jgi:choline dehydrogenase-like flavoprotein
MSWTPVPGVLGTSAAPGTCFEAVLHPDADLEVLAMIQPYGRANGDAPEDDRLSLRVGVQRVGLPGRVRLSAATPHAPPLVRLDHLSDPEDLARARRGVRLAAELLDTEPLSELVARRHGPAANVLDSDAALDAWLLANVGTAMHASGTCAMGPDDDAAAVVDQHGRVRGVAGLRVVDTSIMPTITSRGPAATALMIGERIAELFDRS